ncbi:MAG: DnaD domain protein [Chloroflexi bacterium]|nr:DnaD domain protein [Chloroflexota bacterium]
MTESRPEFSGFPPGQVELTAIPNLFLTQIAPQIEHLGELKVTLFLFWLIGQKKGGVRYAGFGELAGYSGLLAGVSAGADPVAALREALASAVARGTLLRLTVRDEHREEELYLLNTPEGRETVSALREGRIRLGAQVLPEEPAQVAKPNIFTLYEQNIGLLTPLIVAELEEAEQRYPAEWIEAAIREAVAYNRRSWRYVRRILERWERDGRTSTTDRQRHQPSYRAGISRTYRPR